MYDPLVLDNRNLLMQRILDAVGHGYTHHCTGVVTLERAARFVGRMAALYFIDEDRHAKNRAKHNGRGNAMLILARFEGVDDICFWLLVTPPDAGTHPAHHMEQLRDALTPEGRIVVDGFELVRQIKGTLSKEPTRPSWTWRMTAKKYLSWRASIIDAIRQRGSRIKAKNLMFKLFSSAPGFAGARHQVGKLASLYRSEWTRRRGNEAIEPLPKSLRYVRRLPNSGQRLRSILLSTRRMS